MNRPKGYIGRFAPSPTGALHFGSLLAAVASYLDARASKGLWLLRMEDLDPAREPAGAADLILRTLDAFALHWDGPVLYQSQRLPAYHACIEELRNRGLVYRCECSRQTIRAMGGSYDGRCRSRPPSAARTCALRLQVADIEIVFDDLIQGQQRQKISQYPGDYVIQRKDGLVAYQLAVVVDDGFQDITHIVRGHDLLDSTARQIYLQSLLQMPQPVYAHIPVAVNTLGQKLSKQHFAEPIDTATAPATLYRALQFLGQQPAAELQAAPPAEQLLAAVERWDIQAVPKLANILV